MIAVAGVREAIEEMAMHGEDFQDNICKRIS